MPDASIAKQELFARLAEGHAAGITVVTPNRRLARTLRAEFDSFQSGKNLTVWDDADILPLDAFAGRCYDDAWYANAGLPALLSPAQSLALWEQAIRGSRWAGALLDVPQTAARAQEAWRLAQAWRLAGLLDRFDATEDTRAFADWARAYARRLGKEGLIDAPLLPDLDFKNPAGEPALLVAYGFDVLPPQAAEFFARFEAASCSPERKPSIATKASFASPREELEAAARWARARLEAGKGRIGVVVPDLQLRRKEVARVFARVLGAPGAFELSIGEPLAQVPVVAFALQLLEFCIRQIPYEAASRLVRSPFLGGAEGEAAARARLDAKLRREAGAEISLAELIGLIGGNSSLRLLFESVFRKSRENEGKVLSPQHWAQHYTALLAAAGFPGERTLDSAEYQARAKFNEVLGEFSRLGLVTGKVSGTHAVARLRRLCADTLFQPEGAGAPVQVLGLLESAGLAFDALWVSGLTDGGWPQRVRPDPFLPVLLQRRAGIPEASAEASLALDARRTAGWLGAAEEVVVSWARREEDRELSPSPLIAGVPDGAVALPLPVSYRDLIFESGKLETQSDEQAPPSREKTVRGGTRVLADQAACPFRAFARHRLGAQALEAPEPGPDAMQRGQLLHSLMAGIWRELKTKEGLERDVSRVVSKAAENAIKEQGIEQPFAELEKQRLIRLAHDWLDVERQRSDFSVIAVEKKIDMSVGGLSLSGRIDRMDRLADGTHAILDYKTGSRVNPRDWMGERPDDPQLPLYAVSAAEEVSALAYAKLRAGEMGFSGFSSGEHRLPGVKEAKSWPDLLKGWKSALQTLAAGYATGDARVDPKRALQTCRQCDLQPLCRVHERIDALRDDEGGQ